MAQGNFGSRLAEARKKRGLSLDQVHVQLRITPAILEALELADFRHMPLKGHSRNMVSSYARFLGLNSEELTKQFLREYHDYENRLIRQRSSPLPSESLRHEPQSGTVRFRNSENNPPSRSIWDRPIPNSDLGKGYNPRPPASRLATGAAFGGRPHREPNHESSYGAGSFTQKESVLQKLTGALFGNPIILVVTLIVAVVLLLVFWAMAANSCKRPEEVIPVTVAGDGKAGDSDKNIFDRQEDGEVAPNYGPFELAIEAPLGSAPWVEVVVDGEAVFNGILEGKKTWSVTSKCMIQTWQPDNVKITRNDIPLTNYSLDDDTGYFMALEVVERPPPA